MSRTVEGVTRRVRFAGAAANGGSQAVELRLSCLPTTFREITSRGPPRQAKGWMRICPESRLLGLSWNSTAMK